MGVMLDGMHSPKVFLFKAFTSNRVNEAAVRINLLDSCFSFTY